MNGKIMKGIAVALAGMLVMACTGCGGGSGNSQPTAAAQPVVQDTPVTIDAEGDSTMMGWEKDANGNGFQTTKSAPVVLQSLLTTQFAPRSISVINRGVGGASVADSLNGANIRYADPFTKRLAQSSAQIVIENYGINDPQFVTTDVFYAQLTTWVKDVRDAGKIPVLEEPNPICRASLPDPSPYVQIINQVASAQNVPLVKQYDYILSLPNWRGLLTDCVHPGDELYAIKAQREAAVLIPLIAQLPR